MLNSLGWKLWVSALLLVGYCDLAQNILAILWISFVRTAVGAGERLPALAEGAPWGIIWMLVMKKGGWLQPSFLWGSHMATPELREGPFEPAQTRWKLPRKGAQNPNSLSHPQSPLHLPITLVAAVINDFSDCLFTCCLHQQPRLLARSWSSSESSKQVANSGD